MMMKNKSIVGILFFLFCVNYLNAQDKNLKKPNIIYILTDDMGYGDIGVFFQNERKGKGDSSKPWLSTPNLDSMAKQGAQLTQHYCAAPVCAPSRASLLLGLNQGHANVRNNQFDKALEDNYTLANVLKEAGYATIAIGKWGLQGEGEGPQWPSHPLKRGFDDYYGYIRHKDGHEHYPKEGVYSEPKEVYDDYTEVSSGLDKCYTGDLFTARAKKYIIDHKQKNDEKPFFMYLAYDTPHAVLELPTQAYPEGNGLKGGLQWMGKPGKMINTASGKVDSYVDALYENATYDHDKNPNTPEIAWPDTYKRFATVNKRIDDQVGDILQLLRDLKIAENTLVIFTSDNGPSKESYLPKDKYENYTPEFFNNYADFDGIKRDCYEGGLRAATIAFWPGSIAGNQIIDTPSISYDWMVTFADAAGIKAPIRTSGVSLLPSLTGKGEQQESQIYVEYFHPGVTPDYEDFGENHKKTRRKQMQMIRIGNMVGVRYDIKSSADDFKIYNVLKDPGQQEDLSTQYSDLQLKMKEKVLQMRHIDTSASRPYDKALVSSVNPGVTKPGLLARCYQTELPWISEMDDKPTYTTAVENLKIFKQMKGNLIHWKAYIDIPENGEYQFSLETDQKFFVRIDNINILDGDFSHNAIEEFPVMLQKGLHPIDIYIMKDEKKSFEDLSLMWKFNSGEVNPVPEAVFSYSDES